MKLSNAMKMTTFYALVVSRPTHLILSVLPYSNFVGKLTKTLDLVKLKMKKKSSILMQHSQDIVMSKTIVNSMNLMICGE